LGYSVYFIVFYNKNGIISQTLHEQVAMGVARVARGGKGTLCLPPGGKGTLCLPPGAGRDMSYHFSKPKSKNTGGYRYLFLPLYRFCV